MNQANQKRPSSQWRNDRPAHTHSVASSQANGQASPKRPSYLTEVKTELFDFIASRLPNTDETGIQEFTDEVWALLQPKIVTSYWNGIEAGASGRVKPKAQREHSASRQGERKA